MAKKLQVETNWGQWYDQ